MTCATATRLRAGGDRLRTAPAFAEPHPFAGFLRTIGRGATLGRPLDEAEAEQAMAMILDGAVEPVQLGAFLLVLRYRTETPAELAGFVRAARSRITAPDDIAVDLDWPSYADRHKQLPYFLLAALLLAGNGVRVLMHGIDGEGAATTPAALSALGVPALRIGGRGGGPPRHVRLRLSAAARDLPGAGGAVPPAAACSACARPPTRSRASSIRSARRIRSRACSTRPICRCTRRPRSGSARRTR